MVVYLGAMPDVYLWPQYVHMNVYTHAHVHMNVRTHIHKHIQTQRDLKNFMLNIPH